MNRLLNHTYRINATDCDFRAELAQDQPIVQGGQGRDASDVRRDAETIPAMLSAVIGLALLFACVAIIFFFGVFFREVMEWMGRVL